MDLRNALTKFMADALYLPKFQDVACLVSDSVSDILYIRGDQTPTGRWRVAKADPFSTKMPAVGILFSKLTPTTGVMVIGGPVENMFTGLDITKPTFVGANGALVQTSPPPPGFGSLVRVQRFGFPIAADVLWLTGEVGQMIVRRG